MISLNETKVSTKEITAQENKLPSEFPENCSISSKKIFHRLKLIKSIV